MTMHHKKTKKQDSVWQKNDRKVTAFYSDRYVYLFSWLSFLHTVVDSRMDRSKSKNVPIRGEHPVFEINTYAKKLLFAVLVLKGNEMPLFPSFPESTLGRAESRWFLCTQYIHFPQWLWLNWVHHFPRRRKFWVSSLRKEKKADWTRRRRVEERRRRSSTRTEFSHWVCGTHQRSPQRVCASLGWQGKAEKMANIHSPE